jgi:hypothetical protein
MRDWSQSVMAADEGTPNYSPTVGGPYFQALQRLRLTDENLEYYKRRVYLACCVTWVPLFVLSLIDRSSSTWSGGVPFLRDVDLHVRLLIVLPVLVLAEVVVHRRIRPLVKRFVDRRIISEADMPKFMSAVDSAVNARNSKILEFSLIFVVYTAGIWVWHNQIALNTATWYAIPSGDHLRLTLPGYWLEFVSVPIVQFTLLRWYARLCIWFWLLWKISRLNLQLIATHPDGVAGIGFLGASAFAFAPILFAQGCLLSGAIADRVLFNKESVMSFKQEAIALILFMVTFILVPLFMFAPKLEEAKRKCAAEYGLLSSKYVRRFDRKWIRENTADTDELLGTSDIQSLADLNNSFAVVRGMRIAPIGGRDILILVISTAAPFVPLGLFLMPLDELIKKIFHLLFRI